MTKGLDMTQEDDARTFSAKERKKAASSGSAMSDGSFPIKNATDLKNAIRLAGNAKDPAAAKAHIIKRAKALGLTAKLPKGWTTDKAFADVASADGIDCPVCPDRVFFTDEAFLDHADSVHTYSDVQQMVGDTIREKFGRSGDYNAKPPIPSIWTYISDITDEWVVYCVDGPTESQLYRATYSIDAGNNVTLGDPVEVVRRTVYDEVKPA